MTVAAATKNPRPREGVLYIRSIPRDVKDQFKAWCARRGTNMTAKIEDLMRETIKQDPDFPVTKPVASELRKQAYKTK